MLILSNKRINGDYEFITLAMECDHCESIYKKQIAECCVRLYKGKKICFWCRDCGCRQWITVDEIKENCNLNNQFIGIIGKITKIEHNEKDFCLSQDEMEGLKYLEED